MKRISSVALGMMVLACVCPIAKTQDEELHAPGEFAIVDAKALLGADETPVEHATILIEHGKIKAAGAGITVPAGVKQLDAKGKLVTPGLMNSDSQLGLVETGTEDTSDPSVASGWLGESFDVQYALNPNSTLLPVARADGLTRAMVFPTGSAAAPFNGLGAVLRLSEGSEIVDMPGAAMIAEVGGMVVPRSGGSRSAQWMLIREVLSAARESETERAHPAEEERSVLMSEKNIAAMKPVVEGIIPLVLIAYRESDLRQAIALVDEYKIRVVLVGADEAWRVARDLASHKIPVVLDPYASTPATYDQMGARLENAAILDHAGVVISFKAAFVHVSYNAGIAIREGAGVAVANGLSWASALKALTKNAAETWGIAGHYGTIEAGKDADLVIWDGDPLEPASAPVAVFVQGRHVSLETRQTELARRYRPSLANDPVPPAYRQ
jgi:imidazolonepropionase-like amidohydrolase